LGDDASIAIQAWHSLSLHPPLIGQLTGATGQLTSAGAITGATGMQVSNPGPLEFWLLGPFVHLDPGQGVLLGSAILCAVILSVTLEILWRSTGAWPTVIFSLVIADLAITSPTPFLDPVWNSSFGFFWFTAFLGIAFVVGLGNLRYFPLLLFVGSVTVDSHLLYLPSVGFILVATAICGLLNKKPSGRWLWWTRAVLLFCWVGPIYQEFFESRPNLSLLLGSAGTLSGAPASKTEGLGFGLRALSRAASLNPIWASPRPIDPFASSNDISHRNPLFALVLLALVGIAAVAWRHKKPALMSMCVVSIGGSLGVVVLFTLTPASYLLAFVWVNLALWLVGICIWLTLGLAVITAIRSRYGREKIKLSAKARRVGVSLGLRAAGVAGVMVTTFPYASQFVLDWAGVARVDRMTADIEHHLHQGSVSMGVLTNSSASFFQASTDERGAAYLLLTAGWLPGMQPNIDDLLGMPIQPKSAFVVFTERGDTLTSAHFYPHYFWWWFTQKN
jgi:hypothetical protein